MKRAALVAAGAVAALGLAAVPTAATAHTDNLFTWVASTDNFAGFGTTSKTDAAVAALGVNTIAELGFVSGMEICDEIGYAVGALDEDSPFVVTWNHDTGALLSAPVALTVEDGLVSQVTELDTLADCSLLGIAFLEGDVPSEAVVRIDTVTGELTIVADVTGLPLLPRGIATDSAGTTYLFASDYSDNAMVAELDVAAGTYGAPVELAGLVDYYEGGGPTFGVDFDEAGVMWMIIGADAQERYRLTSFAADADLATAEPVDIGEYEFSGDAALFATEPFPLAAEGRAGLAPVAPQLAATGADVPLGVALGAGILLLGGAALVLLRRRAAQ